MKAGQNHTLTVTRISDYGLYLADQEGQEVLLPNRYVSLADKVGDAVDVFVYHDSEDRLAAASDVYKRQTGGLRAKTSFCPTATSRAGSSPDVPMWSTSMSTM